MFDADGLALEGRFAYSGRVSGAGSAVLLCPPHPFLGGDMQNNVINALTTTLADAGALVFRFNYRGIGASQTNRVIENDLQQFWEASTCPEYESVIHTDCRTAYRELRRLVPAASHVYVVGYSFGCLPAIALMSDETVDKLALISPPLIKWPIDSQALQMVIPRGFFFAPGDFACPEQDLMDLYTGLDGSKKLYVFDDADHFFVGHEQPLADAVSDFLVK